MNEIKDGGPAFPVPNDANVNGQEGMTLRDYFAAKAMPWSLNKAGDSDTVAMISYAMADAMLKAREVKP